MLPLKKLQIGIVQPHISNYTIGILQPGEGHDGDYSSLQFSVNQAGAEQGLFKEPSNTRHSWNLTACFLFPDESQSCSVAKCGTGSCNRQLRFLQHFTHFVYT